MNHAIHSIMETVKTAGWKVALFVSCFLFASPVSAQVRTNFDGLGLGSQDPVEIALSLISWFLGILALLAVILILYGGFLWMFSQGDEEKIKKAQDVLKSAVIGLAIILSAWGIVLYILGVLMDATGTGGDGGDGDGDDCGAACSVPGGGSNFYVLSTNPEAGETDVYLCTDITVRFSDYVDQSTVTSDNVYLQVYNGAVAGSACSNNNDCSSSLCTDGLCEGEHVAGTIGFGPGDSTSYINFVPNVDLQSDTVYSAVVVGGSEGVVSEDETPDDGIDDRLSMSTSYSFTFTTGTDTDVIPPTIEETSSSPFPADGETDVCTNTVINFDFSEAMRVSTFNDDTSFVLDGSGTTAAPVAADWVDPLSLDSWAFGGEFDYAQARPATQLENYSLYSTRLYSGDATDDFLGAVTDACGNPLDGDFDGTAEGTPTDDYFPPSYDFDEPDDDAGTSTDDGVDDGSTEIAGPQDPIDWETGENSECTPIITSIDPGYDYYGEYLGLHDGEVCTASSECASGVCTAGYCDGYGATTLTITGLYLSPHPEVLMDGSVVYASEDFNTCFNSDHLGNVETDTTQGDQCLDDALQETTQIVMRTPVGVTDTTVRVSVAEEVSEDSTDILDELSPYIASIDPSEGAPGQYITVSGNNFSDDQGTGTVRMISADGTRESAVSLPEVCGDVWSDEQIVMIAPETYTNSSDGSTGSWVTGDIAYVQVINDEGRHSDLQLFEYSDTVRPNLCQIVDSCDAAGNSDFYVVGDHFGTTQGSNQVAFALSEGTGYTATVSSWGDTQVNGTTSESMGQDSYWVSVYDATTALSSNALSYDIPCNSGPEVVSISSCDQASDIYPVPNPRPNTTDACINSTVGVLFDQDMDTSTFTSSTVYLQQYNSGDTFNSSFTPIAVTGHFEAPIPTDTWSYEYNGDTYYGFQYNIDQTQVDADQDGVADGDTDANLQPNTWYQLTISDGVQNTSGVAMSETYTMRFKTDDTDEVCELATIDLEPNSSTQNQYWNTVISDIERESYTGSPYSAECELLDSGSYSWAWAIADTDIGNFGTGPGSTSSQNVYVAGNTADNEGTTEVTTTVDAISDEAEFTVDLGFCETDSDCASCSGSTCDEETHRCTPVITDIDPTDGDNGTWVVINGCMFGSTAGNVFWNTTDDTVSAETEWPDVTLCDSTWSNTQIVAEVPEEYDSNDDDVRDTALSETTYNVEVVTAYDDSYEGTDVFTLNSTVHPGLCQIEPDDGEVGDSITAYGQGWGTTEGYASFLGDDDYVAPVGADRVSAADTDTTWSNDTINTAVPSGATTGLFIDGGKEGFRVITAGGDEQCIDDSYCSPALDFTVSCESDLDCPSGYCAESGICTEPPGGEECDEDLDCGDEGICSEAGECVANPCSTDADCQQSGCEESSCSDGSCTPAITGLYYDSGPNGGSTTVQGCYFGSYGGSSQVTFTDDAGNTVVAELPCTDSWSDSEIVVEVPAESDLAMGVVADIVVTDSSGDTSNTDTFTVTAECSSGAPVPGDGVPLLCDLIPGTGRAAASDSSTAGDTIEFSGDFQVSTGQNNIFYDEVTGENWVFTDATSSTAEVTNGSDTGNAYINVSSCPSNSLAFGLECTSAADCEEGDYCVEGLCTDPTTVVGSGSCSGSTCTTGTSDAVCGTTNGCYYDSTELSNCCGERPEIVSTSIADGATDICPNAQLQITFSERMTGMNKIRIQEVSSTDPATATILSAVTYTSVITTGSDGANTSTITPATFNTNTIYRLRVPSATDGASVSVRGYTTGLRLLEGSMDYYFTTASSTCVPDHVGLVNDETSGSSYTFTSANSSTSFTTYMYSSDDQLLAPSTDMDWEYTWDPYYDAEACDNVAWVDISESEDSESTGGATSETQVVTSGEEHDGVTTLTSTATATTGWSGSLNDTSTLSTFYCDTGEDWQYVDELGGESYVAHNYPQHFRLIYCDTDELPTMAAPVVSEGSSTDDWFLQYLFMNPDEENQVFSIRVYDNTEHLTPAEWYAQNVPDGSSASETTVDGYEAVRDGLTYYVSASNIDDDGSDADSLDELYNNIYLITFNDEDTLLQIADQIMEYIRFNWDVSYAECDGSDKDMLVRDTKRIADIGTIASLANDYYSTNEEYPEPQSDTFGSYIENITASVWSSWQGALGNVLGQTLPEDPYNFFYAALEDDPWNAGDEPWLYAGDDTTVGQCQYDADNDIYFDTSGTCWDPVNTQFYCPENSHTYLWKVDSSNADNAYLYANMEYDSTTTETYIGSTTALDPCSDTSNSECSCYNYSISSATDPGGTWQ